MSNNDMLNIYNLKQQIDYRRKVREHIDSVDESRLPKEIRFYKSTVEHEIKAFKRWNQIYNM